MTLVALPSAIAYPEALDWGITGRTSHLMTLLDASGEKKCWVIRVPVAGTISKVGFRVGTPVTTAQSLDIRIETVDVTNGRPSGTLWAANTSGAVASPTADTWFWVTLTAGATVAIGDNIAIVIQFTSTVGNLNISGDFTNLGRISTVPYGINFLGGVWSKNNRVQNVAIELSTGSRPYIGTVPVSGTGLLESWGPAAQYNEKGTRFNLPFPAKCIGAMARISSAGSIFDIRLYDGADVKIGNAFSIDSDWQAPPGVTVSQEPPAFFLFPASTGGEVTLNAGEIYRLVAFSQDAPITIESLEVDSHETLEAHPGGIQIFKTERKDNQDGTFGLWDVSYAASQKQRMLIYPLLSAVDDGSSLNTTPRILLRREFQHEASGLTDP